MSVSLDVVLKYFKEICAIPHGSQDMKKISLYCADFAEKNSLKYVRDDANNVIIYKNGSCGYENSAPVILQGHLDMVCQKTPDCEIDFAKDPIETYTDGDFLRAKNTTLGADNGIAVAMVLAILADNTIAHPPIEAVFTTDEEIGMIGALKLDFSLLSAKKMINLDSEEGDTVTVSCAGGSDFSASLPIKRKTANGTILSLTLSGLKGGHSGVEINKGRINADILAGRFLNHLATICDFDIISIDGGDKGNAIPNSCNIELLCQNPQELEELIKSYYAIVQKELSAREDDFTITTKIGNSGDYSVFDAELKRNIISILTSAPNGVIEMSAEIDGLVETSLNLGILKTENDKIILHFALRSNKQSALEALEEKLSAYFSLVDCTVETFGHYPPWEFKADSDLRKIYTETYKELFNEAPKVQALHAGLECGVFASGIEGLDCIAIGPDLFDVHTVNERMSIPSTKMILDLLLKILEKSR